MRLLLGLWVFMPVAALACDALRGDLDFCSDEVHIAFDATRYMGTPDNVAQVFNFISDYLTMYRGTATMYDVNFYGSSDPGWDENFVNTSDGVCDVLARVQSNLPNSTDSMNTVTLTELVSIWNGGHDIVLFTATTDQNDIDQAGAMTQCWMAPNNVTIVYMGDNPNVDFSGWRSTQVICAQLPFQTSLPLSILLEQCGQITSGTNCRVATNAPTGVSITTDPPQDTTQPDQPTAAPTPNTNNVSLCPCDLSKVWNDVSVLFDGSTGMNKNKFEEMTDFVISSFSQMSIGQALQFNTRVSISVYGSNVTNVAPLDKYQSFNDLVSQDFKQLNDPYTNVKE